MLQQQAYLIATRISQLINNLLDRFGHNSPSQARSSNVPAAQAQLINNLLDRFGQNTRSAPIVASPVGQAQPIHPLTLTYLVLVPSHPKFLTHLHLPTIRIAIFRTHSNSLIETSNVCRTGKMSYSKRERLRTARELNTPAAVHVPDANNHVFSSEQERWEAISNTSMGHHNQLHRAAAPDNSRSAGLHRNTDQMVNDRIADLGNDATARRSGGQGVYPPNYIFDNPNQPKYGNSQTVPQPNFSECNPYGNHLQGESHPLPTKRISSGRDRTGSDNIARLAIPWPNEHCLIGVDRRQVTYDQLTHPQWQAGPDEHPGNGAKPPLS